MKEYIDQNLKEKLQRINISDIISRYTNNLEYLSKEDVTYILKGFECLKELFKWMEKVEEYAIEKSVQAKDAKLWDKFKLVPGRSILKFDLSKEAMIVETLRSLNCEPYKSPQLRSVTEIRKDLGKERFETFLLNKNLLHKPQGKPVLVSEEQDGEPIEFN